MKSGGVVCVALLAALCVLPAHAETFPDHPVKVITHGPAGSAPDVYLRIVADQLGRRWDRQVQVLNHPGAAGAIAARAAAAAPADGYTLYMPAATAFVTLPGTTPGLPLQLPRDFVPIGFVSEQPQFIAVASSLGVSTLPELIALAKKRPGEIGYAILARGNIGHLAGELLQAKAGIKLTAVPYSGGPAQAQADILSGRVPIIIEAYAGIVGLVETGTVKLLAVMSPTRLPDFPDLPTVAETLPGFSAVGWFALVAPIGTPDPVIQRVSTDLGRVLAEPELKAKFAKLGAYVRPMSPPDVLRFVESEQRQWIPVLRQIEGRP